MNKLEDYNNFCALIDEGDILYNVDNTNGWGEYLLVINVSKICIQDIKTYSVLLLGIKKYTDRFTVRNLRIALTPDYVNNIPYLKKVGHCSFQLQSTIDNVAFNKALVAAYGNTQLRKYHQKSSFRKPRKRKYDKAGNLVIKKISN